MNNKYQIIEDYKDNKFLRSEFHLFISEIFPGISFIEWESKGFWIDKYIPFSIYKSGKIISNVSASFMDIIIHSRKYKGIQIGAVGTLPEYRNQGLSRELMNYVIHKYNDEVDLFFLFANTTVLEFYTKFGFRCVQEFIFIRDMDIPKPNYSVSKLNIKNNEDYRLLCDQLKNRQALTKIFGAENYGFITMWHILNVYENDIYYLEQDDIIIIKQEKDNTLHIIDVLYRKTIDLVSVIPKIIESDSIKLIKFYFPPDQLNYRYDKTKKINTGLFILGDLDLTDIPFRFPITAIT